MAIKNNTTEAMSGFSIAFSLALFISLVVHGYGREHRVISEEDDLEIERELKILNKPALKSLWTEYGHIIDCVDIYKQPALDHPLLKNHKIQRRPSFAPPVVNNEGLPLAKQVKVSKSNGCPSGTVPIRRTTKTDLIRSKLSKPANINTPPPPAGRPASHFSYVSLRPIPGENFYGAKAYIDAYNPKVEDGQSSAAQLWIEGGPLDQFNSIQVGWVVEPGLYGDNLTHMFTYWTGDAYKKTGCYDILCPGFVQINKDIPLGAPLSNTSTINGDQYVMLVSIYQDPKTENWWFVVNNNNTQLGYWPKELFPHFVDGANILVYGGRAQGVFDHLSPPMGSGLFPDGNFRHACFFSQLQFLSKDNQLVDPAEHGTRAVEDISGCYRVDNHGWEEGMGYTFSFGGPGGHCGN